MKSAQYTRYLYTVSPQVFVGLGWGYLVRCSSTARFPRVSAGFQYFKCARTLQSPHSSLSSPTAAVKRTAQRLKKMGAPRTNVRFPRSSGHPIYRAARQGRLAGAADGDETAGHLRFGLRRGMRFPSAPQDSSRTFESTIHDPPCSVIGGQRCRFRKRHNFRERGFNETPASESHLVPNSFSGIILIPCPRRV